MVQKYDSVISIRGVNRVVIGGLATASIRISDKELGGDYLTLTFRGTRLFISEGKAREGVYVNGTKCTGEQEIKDTDFFALADYGFYYKNGCLYTDSTFPIKLQGLRYVLSVMGTGAAQYPKFVRNVRKKTVLSTEPITVLDPPQKPAAQKNNLFLQLLPAVGSIMLVVLLRGVMGGGGSFVIFSACTMALGAVTTVITFFTGKRDYKKDTEKRKTEYGEYIQNKIDEIRTARQMEARQLQQIFWGPRRELQLIQEFSGDLFDRQAGDQDYLNIRVGEGKKPALRQIKITEKESITVADELFSIPKRIADEYRYIPDAPVCLDAMKDNAIGVVGDENRLREMLKIMSLDLVSRQYHSDLKLVYFIEHDDIDQLAWVRWLPHVKNEALGASNIVCDEKSKTSMFEFLFAELSMREQSKYNWPHYVVFMLDDYGIMSHPIRKYIPCAKEMGFTFIFFVSQEDLLPQGCDEVVTLERGSSNGSVYKTNDLNQRSEFTFSMVSDREIEAVALTISPVYSEDVSLENSLTKSLTFFEMLGVENCAGIDLERNWANAAVVRSMTAPIGVKTKNEIVYLDLHEKAHGPHGLVAGTTGSGKSELLQSYVLSMAVAYHPYEVGFVIIDFKGGGMVNQFRDLPHLLGAITNIDGKEIDRSLKYIRAELQKRMRLFREAEVNHIDKYITKFKAGEVTTPLPRLILIVDEFAELKAEQPEFMRELISAVRIGRSLGVHLILATQKPSGQVDDQIWSNSRFRICLKVQTREDSNEVLKSPLAAEIKEAGRAYLQVGNDELFELFQSAYSGAPANTVDDAVKEYAIYKINATGRKMQIFSKKRRKTPESNETQLDTIVDYIRSYCNEQGINRLESICLPPLPDKIDFPKDVKVKDGCVEIGIYDDPENQFQGTAYVDLDHRNTIVLGSSQYGKTNILQGFIRSIATEKSPDEANIYIIDFGSMALKNFETLLQVGGVVCATEDEKLKNLFKLLLSEITTRKEKLLSVGVSSFTSYIEAGYKDLPQMYLIIDNLTALVEMYLVEDDSLLTIVREGISMGISTIVANAQTSGIGYRYLPNFQNRIALFCNDSGEYYDLYDQGTTTPDGKPGRCILEIDKRIVECQAYLSFSGDKEFERVNEMQHFITRINEQNESKKAKIIPFIPAVLDLDTFYKVYDLQFLDYLLPVGLTYRDVEPLYINISQIGLLGICGKSNTGHKNFVQYLMRSLENSKAENPARVIIFDDVTRKFSDLKTLDIVETYTLDIEQISTVIETWHSILMNRYNSLMAGGEEGKFGELLMLIIQNNDVANYINDNSELLEKYTEMVTRYKNMNVAVIFANYPNVSLPYDAPEPLRMIKQNQQILFFEDLDNLKPFDVSYDDMRANKKRVKPGDAYYIQDNSVTKLKIVKADF